MQIRHLCLLVVAMLLQWSPLNGAVLPRPEVASFLSAIRAVEAAGRYDCRPGAHGEQGPYQFKREVWHHYTTRPLTDARTAFADVIALQHYNWIVSRLTERGVCVTDWTIAASWNAGVGAVAAGKIPSRTRDYADRVTNLCVADAALRRRLSPTLLIALGDG